MKLNRDYGVINRIYGVTRDPETKEYAIVTEFQNEGNLRRLIAENHAKLTWKNVIYMLYTITNNLYCIHYSKLPPQGLS